MPHTEAQFITFTSIGGIDMLLTRCHLLKLGFKRSVLEYQSTLGKLDHISRIRPGGPKVYTVDQVLQLARDFDIPVDREDIHRVLKEV